MYKKFILILAAQAITLSLHAKGGWDGGGGLTFGGDSGGGLFSNEVSSGNSGELLNGNDSGGLAFFYPNDWEISSLGIVDLKNNGGGSGDPLLPLITVFAGAGEGSSGGGGLSNGNDDLKPLLDSGSSGGGLKANPSLLAHLDIDTLCSLGGDSGSGG